MDPGAIRPRGSTFFGHRRPARERRLPAATVARRPGNAGGHTGTAARRAAAAATPTDDGVVCVSAPTPAGKAAHRPGNAGLRPATRRPHGTRQRSAGQFSRWGPPTGIAAREGRDTAYRQSVEWFPSRPVQRVARWHGNAGLRPVLPVGAGTAARRAANHVPPLSAIVRQARERRPPASSRGGGRRRCATAQRKGRTPNPSMALPFSAVPTERHGTARLERRPPASSPGGALQTGIAPVAGESPFATHAHGARQRKCRTANPREAHTSGNAGLRPAPRPAGPRNRVYPFSCMEASSRHLDRRDPLDRPATPSSPHQRRPFLERQTLRLEESNFPSVNTSATRLTGLSRRRDTSSRRPSRRGGRRAGIRHRPGGRKVSMTVRPLWFAFRGQRGGCVACWIRRLAC